MLKTLLMAALAAAIALLPMVTPAESNPWPVLKTVAIGDGITLHYVDQGQGVPVIFIHGSLSDGGYWNDQLPVFAKRYRVIAYSRRYNFPNTNPSRPGYSAVTDAQDVSALIERLHLGKVYVVGHSYGALTALFLAVKHPEQIRKVVLAEPPAVSLLKDLPGRESSIGLAMFDDIQRRMVIPMERQFRAKEREAGVATFIDYVLGDPHAWDKFSLSSKQATMLDAHEWDVMMTAGTLFPSIDPAAVTRIKVPVLIISGAKSYPFLGLIDRELARLIPGSKHFILPRDGHQMWYQDPVLCRQSVEEFFQASAPSRKRATNALKIVSISSSTKRTARGPVRSNPGMSET